MNGRGELESVKQCESVLKLFFVSSRFQIFIHFVFLRHLQLINKRVFGIIGHKFNNRKTPGLKGILEAHKNQPKGQEKAHTRIGVMESAKKDNVQFELGTKTS